MLLPELEKASKGEQPGAAVFEKILNNGLDILRGIDSAYTGPNSKNNFEAKIRKLVKLNKAKGEVPSKEIVAKIKDLDPIRSNEKVDALYDKAIKKFENILLMGAVAILLYIPIGIASISASLVDKAQSASIREKERIVDQQITRLEALVSKIAFLGSQ